MTSPREREREKEKAMKNAGKGNHNQDQAGPPDEGTGQRRLDGFGITRQRVEIVGVVQEHDDGFEMPRADRAGYVFCVHNCKNVMSECLEVPSWLVKVVSAVQVSEEPAGTHELELDRSTGEMLLTVGCGSVVSTCPVDHATSVPT